MKRSLPWIILALVAVFALILRREMAAQAMLEPGSLSDAAVAFVDPESAEHLRRVECALEGAPLGIRSNVVNPDAVIRGSKIWTGKWSEERAAANKIDEGDLEAFYRDRSMLKRSVFPEDIAEATYFFAAEHLSAKSTGNILNVDAGNLAAFTR